MAFDVGNRLWDGRRPQDGHMMEMSYRCCCAAAGMVFLPHSSTHSTRLHPSHVPGCSAGARSPNFDMLPLTVCALSATVMTGRQCCRHVGTASAACSANVPHLRTTLWTSVFGCGVLLRSLSNQTPRSTWAPWQGPVDAPSGGNRGGEGAAGYPSRGLRHPINYIFATPYATHNSLCAHCFWSCLPGHFAPAAEPVAHTGS